MRSFAPGHDIFRDDGPASCTFIGTVTNYLLLIWLSSFIRRKAIYSAVERTAEVSLTWQANHNKL